jgi:HlyD family secretion protein
MAELDVVTTTKTVQGPDGKKTPAAAATPPREVVQQVRKKKKSAKPVYLVIGLLIVAGAVWFLFFRTPAKAPLVVRYAAVDVGDISRGVTATGTLQPITTVQVGSQVSGMITDLYADFNTKVKKGQLLAKLDSSTFEAAVTQAQANLAKAQSDLANASKTEARNRQLLTAQLIAQSDYDLSKNQLEDAKATVDQTAASLKQAEANLGYTVIRSPISGVVVARDVDRGQTVAAGFNAPVLFVIAEDLTKMQVAANVDEADIGQVDSGQDVKFSVDAYPGEQFEGYVEQVRINSVTTSNVVTYTVMINTPNPDERLLPGMTATVNIVNASRTGVLRVPIAATRLMPPPELLAEAGEKDTSAHVRKQRAPGDTTHHGSMGGSGGAKGQQGANRPQMATIFVKSNVPAGPALKRVRIVEGLSDPNYTEILSSTPLLQAGDSVVVAAFEMTTSGAPASSPLSTPRPTGGGRGGRF